MSTFRSQYGAFINGNYVNSNTKNVDMFAVANPATSAHITNVIAAKAPLVNEAIECAHKVYESGIWSRSDVRYRAKVVVTNVLHHFVLLELFIDRS